jgi:thiol-disulfide isomerase/thioredoxin
MKELYLDEEIDRIVNENKMVLLYFGSYNCNVCIAVKPKIEEMLKKYPKIVSAEVEEGNFIKAAATYNIFTFPVILLFIEGKETLREARYISIQDIDSKIGRYYNLLFQA